MYRYAVAENRYNARRTLGRISSAGLHRAASRLGHSVTIPPRKVNETSRRGHSVPRPPAFAGVSLC
jgi:hypothetical protein